MEKVCIHSSVPELESVFRDMVETSLDLPWKTSEFLGGLCKSSAIFVNIQNLIKNEQPTDNLWEIIRNLQPISIKTFNQFKNPC